MGKKRFKNLGRVNEWKEIPKELQECIDKGHIGEKDYLGKKGTTIHRCPKCRISYLSQNNYVLREVKK